MLRRQNKGRPSRQMEYEVAQNMLKRPRIDEDEVESEESTFFQIDRIGNIQQYIEEMVLESQVVRNRVFGNWKFLKEDFFKPIFPKTLLTVLKEGNVIKDEYIVNINEVTRPLAFDYILFEVIKYVTNEGTFRTFADIIEKTNQKMEILWDKHIEHEHEHEKDQNLIKSFKENRRRLEDILKRDCIIQIKDNFVEKLIFSLEDHQKIHGQLVNNIQPVCFVDIVLNDKKICKGSISCMKNSLKQQAAKYSRIRTFLKDLDKKEESPQPNASGQMTLRLEESKIQSSEEQITRYMTKIEIKSGDEEKVNKALQKGVVKAAADIVKTHHSIVEKTEPGCLEIYLKSLDGNITQLITDSLTDGGFLSLLKKIINEEEMKKILLPGKYRLKTKIVSLQGINFSNPFLSTNEDLESVQRMKSQLIPANRFFLKREIDVEQLLTAFGSRRISFKTEFLGSYIEKAELFLRLIEQNNLEEKFCEVLKEEKMTYVYDRLHTFQKVYTYSDFESLRKNIVKMFPEMMTAVDLDEIKEVFIERNFFTKDKFDEIEQTFEEQPDQAVGQFLVSILISGSLAMLTFVDALYICGMNEFADSLLQPVEDSSRDTEHTYSSSEGSETGSEKLLFEGIYELIINQTDDTSCCAKQKITDGVKKDKSYIETPEPRVMKPIPSASEELFNSFEIKDKKFNPAQDENRIMIKT